MSLGTVGNRRGLVPSFGSSFRAPSARQSTVSTGLAYSYIGALVDSATYLNDTSPTFTRATSAYDPIANTINGAGVRRRRTVTVGLRTLKMDLIEGSRTNLLAAGSSESLTLAIWTKTNTTVLMDATGPSGETNACTLTASGVSGQRITQDFVCNATTASISFLVKPGTLSTTSILLYNVTTASALSSLDVNISSGATSNLVGTATATAAGGGWYRLTASASAGITSGNTLRLYMYVGTSGSNTAGTIVATQAMAEAAAFPSSYISNRNLLLQTPGMTTSWTQTDTTPTANSGVNPLTGLTNVTLFTEGSAGTASNKQTATIVAGTTITLSVYLAKDNTNILRVECASTSTNGFRCWVNVNTGAIGTAALMGTGTYTSSHITSVGSSWRVDITGTVAAASTAPVVLICSASADNSTTRVNGATYYASDVQLEYGTAPTGVWNNSTAVGLRAADALTSTYSLSTTAGTILHLVIPYGWTGDQDGSAVWELSRDNDASSDLATFRTSATQILMRRQDSAAATNQTGAIGHGLTNGTLGQIAQVWDSASNRGYVAGVQTGAVSSAPTMPYDAVAVVKIGAGTSANREAYGWVAVPYWDRALIAGELLALVPAATA